MRLRKPQLLFLSTFLLGWGFFLFPVIYQGKITVPFDVAISYLRRNFPVAAEITTFLLVASGAILSLYVAQKANRLPSSSALKEFATTRIILGFRLAGLVLALIFLFRWTPPPLQQAGIERLIWQTLAVSVALIIPLGAMVVQLFVSYGGMDFMGTLAEPVMRPLFRLPGRAALDALTSWVGSYSVGLYITRTVYLRGGYTRQHVFILATCFSTVSMGFVGVVASTLNLLHLFPLILIFYFLCIVLLTAILVRMPPIKNVPQLNFHQQALDDKPAGQEGSLWMRAWKAAVQQAEVAPPIARAVPGAFVDGLRLAASILGTIVSVGTLALLLAKFTPIFDILGKPLIPLLRFLHLPAAGTVAPAVLIEVTEMYIPALLVVNAPEAARFFIAVLSISQLIFFSSLGPMIMDMFRDIPIKASQLLTLFCLRTLILLPFLAAVVYGLTKLRILH